MPGNLPWPVPILLRSQLRRQSKSDWLTPRRERPVRHGWRLGRIVRRRLLLSRRSRGGGGREDLGWPLAKPVSLGQRYADPVGPPTHRRSVTSFATTAVEIYGRGRRPINPAGCLGGPGPHRRSRCSLDGWGRREGWPLAAPVRLRLAGRPVAQWRRNWSILKTSFFWSMW